MGLALARKKEISVWYPPMYTFWTTGVAASITTFSTWMEEGYLTFGNYSGYQRGGLYDVSALDVT
jgi:CrcB protein